MTDKIKIDGYVPIDSALTRDLAQGYAEMLYALTKTRNAFFVLQPMAEGQALKQLELYDNYLDSMIYFIKQQFQIMSVHAITLEGKSED